MANAVMSLGADSGVEANFQTDEYGPSIFVTFWAMQKVRWLNSPEAQTGGKVTRTPVWDPGLFSNATEKPAVLICGLLLISKPKDYSFFIEIRLEI